MASISGGESLGRSQRQGSTLGVRSTVVPTFLSNIISSSINNAAVPADISQASDNLLKGLLTRDNATPQGADFLNTAMDFSPTGFAGQTSLENVAAIDPTTSTYEQDTMDKYRDRVNTGLAEVATGPDVVRGGTARGALTAGEAINRMALERSDEIRRAQLQDATMSREAANMANAIEMGRRQALLTGQNQIQQQYLAGVGQSLEANQAVTERGTAASNLYNLGTRVLGSDVQAQSENSVGQGAQANSSFGAGINCCFIFLAGLDNQLPWYVRRARDIFSADVPSRRTGYTRMSKWLVPLMLRHTKIKGVVKLFLITPLMKYGAWMFGEEDAKPRWRWLKPYVFGWFKLWEVLGRN